MAKYKDLPVYKAAYDLMLRIYKMGQHWPRDLRYQMGAELKREMTDLLVDIIQANSATDKMTHIHQAQLHMIRIKIYLRTAHDLKAISLHGFTYIALQTESVSKQLAAWEKYYRDKRAETGQP